MSINTQFETELKKLLHARMDEIRDILSDGQAIRDYPEYCKYVGCYQTCKLIVESLCEQINTTLNQR